MSLEWSNPEVPPYLIRTIALSNTPDKSPASLRVIMKSCASQT